MDIADMHWLWKETYNRLADLRARVNEGRDVMAASEFCRWIQFSGLLKLFRENAQDGFFKVDAAILETNIKELLALCNYRFRTGDKEPTLHKTELESMREKIDKMAGYLSRLTAAPAVSVNPLPDDDFSDGGAVASREAAAPRRSVSRYVFSGDSLLHQRVDLIPHDTETDANRD